MVSPNFPPLLLSKVGTLSGLDANVTLTIGKHDVGSLSHRPSSSQGMRSGSINGRLSNLSGSMSSRMGSLTGRGRGM